MKFYPFCAAEACKIIKSAIKYSHPGKTEASVPMFVINLHAISFLFSGRILCNNEIILL